MIPVDERGRQRAVGSAAGACFWAGGGRLPRCRHAHCIIQQGRASGSTGEWLGSGARFAPPGQQVVPFGTALAFDPDQ
jgi:hypothetical protein